MGVVTSKRPVFTVDQIPDLTGHGDDRDRRQYRNWKGDALLEKNAKNETNGKEAVFLELDLGSLLPTESGGRVQKNLHVLFNNAAKTADGYDLCLGTNQLGHFLLHSTFATDATRYGSKRRSRSRRPYASGAVQSAPKGGIVWETLGKDRQA
ncbi:oxidoreductase family protein [Ceratobasidium sp. AG-Ba]|nr:oxidoreductase family protein [Ceratobasidium sp. AG-Ba]